MFHVKHGTMKKEEFNRALLRALKRQQIRLEGRAVDQLFLYHEELFSWNEQINLIGREEEERFVERHLTDALCALKLPRGEGDRILDLGSGNGLPGVPLAIALPHVDIELLESRVKRCTFLRHIVAMLKLDHAQILCGRFEEWYTRLHRYRYILARGVRISRQMAVLMSELLVKGGGLVLYQSARQRLPHAIVPATTVVEGVQGRRLIVIDDVTALSRVL